MKRYSGIPECMNRKDPTMKLITPIMAGALLAGCATVSQPVLYPNAKFKQVGEAAAQRDVDDCIALAERAGASSNTGAGARSGLLQGAAIGGAAAAVGSLIGGGRFIENAAAGAAIGGAAGAAGGAVQGSQGNASAYNSYVGRCLAERGYDVMGWK